MTDTDTTTRPPYPATPTLDQMKGVHEQSQAIGEFIESLSDYGLTIATWLDRRECRFDNGKYGSRERVCRGGRLVCPHMDDYDTDADYGECEACGGTGEVECDRYVVPGFTGTIEALLARHFGVDLDAAERERMAVLEWVRSQQ